jgi:2-dehydro-3-deoxy-L-rhamnonate dehydrogenase (NAD+)
VSVAAIDRDEAGAQETAAMAGCKAKAFRADATNDAELRTCLARVEQELGGLQAFVNCAAITGKTNVKAHEFDLEDFDRVYKINLRAALVVMAASCMLPPSQAKTATPAWWPIRRPRPG